MKDLGLISHHNINSYPELLRYWNNLDIEEKRLSFDQEGLWSYSPQMLAINIAHSIEGREIVDLFCGVGGSSIGFAKAEKHVVAIDISETRLKLAKLNSEKAGVKDKICFYNKDAFSFLKTLNKTDCVFLDPPWGGKIHREISHFSLKDFKLDVKQILEDSLKIAEKVIIKLPFNFRLQELLIFNKKFTVVEHHMPSYEQDRPFFITVHFS